MSWFRSPTLRWIALGSAVVIGAATVTSLLLENGGAAPAAAQVGGCGTGVPASKCVPISGPTGAIAAPGTTTTPPPPPADLAPTPSSAPTIGCGTDFFSNSTWNQLEAHFGQLNCFQFQGSDQWIVFGDGMSVTSTATPPGSAPGGSVVAVMNCASSPSSACMEADSPHSFSSFTVYYPPDPGSGRSDLAAFDGSGRLVISDGYCSVFVFDANTLTWYLGDAGDAEALAQGQLAHRATVPPPVAGDRALQESVPASTGDCPQY